MISFDQLTTDVVLDCDVEPKTRFRLRSLRFSDLAQIEAAKDAAGVVSPSALRQLQQRVKAGETDSLSDDETATLNTNYQRSIAGEIKICSLGVVEIDCKPVTPDEVAQMLDCIPPAQRDKVRGELAMRITQLGAPSPKSGEPSESQPGSGVTPTMQAGVVSSVSCHQNSTLHAGGASVG